MASVAEAAAQLRADLQLLDASTKEAAALLDLASWQLGELGRAAAPMTSKTLALARAKENISAAKQRSEEVLEHLDASRKMQGVIQAGPRANLEAFLAALGRLEAAIDFLAAHRSMQSAEDALRHTAALRDSALGAAAQEFAALLQKHSAAPQALLARLRAGSFGSSGGGTAARASAAGPDAAGSAALELLPEAVLPKLKALAGAMLRGSSGTNAGSGSSSGGGRACIKAYADARRGVMQGSLEPFLSPFAGSKEELAWQQVAAKIPG
jgi:exocyst complex protein 7